MHCWHYGGSTSWMLVWILLQYVSIYFMMYKSWFFLKNIFLQIFPTVRGSMNSAELSACSMNRLVHLGIYKGGAHSEISAGTQGEDGQRNVYLGKIISWLTLFPWCQRGRVIWLLLPSSPKGKIVGIMIHMLYLMATHSSQMINYSAKKFTLLTRYHGPKP